MKTQVVEWRKACKLAIRTEMALSGLSFYDFLSILSLVYCAPHYSLCFIYHTTVAVLLLSRGVCMFYS